MKVFLLLLAVVMFVKGETTDETSSTTPFTKTINLPTTAANTTDSPVKIPEIVQCKAPNGPGECIPFYLCNNNLYIVGDGSGAIDWRRRRSLAENEQDDQCSNTFETCCALQPSYENVEENYLKHTICGLRKSNDFVRPENPLHAAEDEFPWTIVILERRESISVSNRSAYACVGSLIHPSVVLTAAHCINERRKNYIYVRAGAHNLSNSEESVKHQNRDIDEIIVHEEFNPTNGRNDIALLILNKPIELNEHVSTICLAPNDLDLTGEQCFVSGFGEIAWHRQHSPVMKRIDVPIVSRDACQFKLRNERLGHRYTLHKSFLCAGGKVNMDTCKGDGGAPLICKVPGIINQFLQVGISSWGIRCGGDIPGVYANVANLRNWIDGQLERKNINTISYDPDHYIPIEE